MYCRKCGKQLDYDGTICKECEQADVFGELKGEVGEAAARGSRKEGLKFALTSVILGAVAVVLSAMAMGVATAVVGMAEGADMSVAYLITLFFVFAFICLIASIGLMIPSIILGVKSIKCFIRAKNEGKIKPIPTLICGIAGIVASAVAALYAMLAFIMIVILL